MNREDEEYLLGGVAAIHDEMKIMNEWLHRIYNVNMVALQSADATAFDTVNLVHNKLGLFMEDDWENDDRINGNRGNHTGDTADLRS